MLRTTMPGPLVGWAAATLLLAVLAALCCVSITLRRRNALSTASVTLLARHARRRGRPQRPRRLLVVQGVRHSVPVLPKRSGGAPSILCPVHSALTFQPGQRTALYIRGCHAKPWKIGAPVAAVPALVLTATQLSKPPHLSRMFYARFGPNTVFRRRTRCSMSQPDAPRCCHLNRLPR